MKKGVAYWGKKLTRYSNSAWKLVGEKQSRINHLNAEARMQV